MNRQALFDFRLPVRFLRGNYTRLALTVIALALGVSLVCAIDLVNRAISRAFAEIIDTMAGRAALQVSAGEGGVFPESLVDTVAVVPGVELAVPVITATAFMADETGELLTVHGVDVANEAAVRIYESRDQEGLNLDDPLVFLNQPDSIVLTKAFAERRRLKVNDGLVLETSVGRRSFVIRGLLDPKGIARVYGGNLVIMDLPAAQLTFARSGLINRIDVVLGANGQADVVSDAIREVLPAGLRVEPPGQRRADLNRVMQSLQIMLQAMGLVGLVTAFLIGFSRLAAVFEARAWQLGILRSSGVRRRVLWWELMKESIVLGAAGVLLGIPAGIGIARLLLPVIARTAALNFKLIAPEAELGIGLPSIAVAALLGIGAAVLAAALPAWRAARVDPVETIRGRGVEQPGGNSRAMWIVRAATLAAVGVTIAIQSATHLPAWGMIATGLIAVAAALGAHPLLSIFRSVISPSLIVTVGPVGRFAVAMFARNTRRTALTVAMLGVGVGSILWLRTVAHSFERSLTAALSSALQGDLVVTSSHIAAGYVEAPLHEELQHELKNIPGVGDTAGERLVDWHHAGGPIAIDAFDPGYFTSGQFGRWRLLGSEPPGVWDDIADGKAVLVSSNFALNLDADVGSLVELETPSGPISLPIVGITVNFSSPRGTIIMSRDVYKRFWRDGQVNRVFLNVIPGTESATVRAAIARQLGRKYGLRILAAGELLSYFTDQVQLAFAPINVLAILVFVVILVGIVDTLAADVAGRVREFGAMRALGARRRQLDRMVLAEGMVLGSLGLLLAVWAGGFLGTLWVSATFPYLLGWSLDVYVPFGGLAVVIAATMTICVVAAVWPARRAAMLEPAAALRYE